MEDGGVESTEGAVVTDDSVFRDTELPFEGLEEGVPSVVEIAETLRLEGRGRPLGERPNGRRLDPPPSPSLGLRLSFDPSAGTAVPSPVAAFPLSVLTELTEPLASLESPISLPDRSVLAELNDSPLSAAVPVE